MCKRYGGFRNLGLLFSICIVVFQLAGCGGDSSTGSTPTVSAPDTPYVNTGFPRVVTVSGTNYEMGVQYGNQVADAIVHNLAIFKSKLYAAKALDPYFLTSADVDNDMLVWDYYVRKFDPTLVDWISGIAAGCREKGYRVSYYDIFMIMVYPTESWARPSAQYPAETGITGGGTGSNSGSTGFHSCSSFAATGSLTADGKPIHAITQMVNTEVSDNVILIAFPTNGSSFVTQDVPGKVVGNNGMNINGFAWTMTAIMSDNPSWGLGEGFFHYLSQVAKTPAEAMAYINSTTKGGVTGGFILSDATSIQAMEVSGQKTAVRKPGDLGESNYLVQTNNLNAPTLTANNPSWLEAALGTFTRYNTVAQYLIDPTRLGAAVVDFEFTKKLFASDDWYDKSTNTWHTNTRNSANFNLSDDHTSVSQSIYFPAKKIAYMQTGTPSGIGLPAYATGEYVKIQLAAAPKAVSDQAEADALNYYWDAADLLEYDTNNKQSYLTLSVASDIKGKLDNAFAAFTAGEDRAGWAALTTDPKQKMSLWASALTYYAKSQLYAQMAKTTLIRQRGNIPLPTYQ